MKISKITINTYVGKTARLTMSKDGIKVELEKKRKRKTLHEKGEVKNESNSV